MNSTPHTRLALLGTMSDLHRQSLKYDLACLRELIAERNPDILCAEITLEAWEHNDIWAAGLEVREALVPIEELTDIVLVPVAPSMKQYEEFVPKVGWRRRIAKSGLRLLRWGQRKAGSPEAIHGSMFGAFCHTMCVLTESAWKLEEREAWDRQNREMAENILQAVRRDPGRRVLVVVQCQRLHRLSSLLKAHSEETEIVRYQDL